jgi:hypothetical protein
MPIDPSELEWFHHLAPSCDYFSLLAVDRSITHPDELRAAARRQADRLAPFRSGTQAEHAERLLKRIGRAYRTLADPDRRADYLARARAKKINRANDSFPMAGPFVPSTADLFVDEALSPTPTLVHFESMEPTDLSRPTLRRPVRRAIPWISGTSIFFLLLNLGMLGYWWNQARVPAGQGTGVVPAPEGENRQGLGADRVESSSGGANLPPPERDPNLDPSAFGVPGGP